MSDLVKYLRAHVAADRPCKRTEQDLACGRAASEIESLRARLARLEEVYATTVDCWKADGERLAEAERDWYKHPKAQLEIGLKARLRLELQHIEEIVRGTPRDDLGIDDDYWSTLCDDALKLRDRLAEAEALLRDVVAQDDEAVEALDFALTADLRDDIDAYLSHKEQK